MLEERSEECSSGHDWSMSNKALRMDIDAHQHQQQQQQQQQQQHDGLSSQSSVSGRGAASPQNSVSSSTFKEHDYIGMSEVSSADASSKQDQMDLHLQETELRLGPLGDSKTGASFQPKPAAAAAAASEQQQPQQALNLSFEAGSVEATTEGGSKFSKLGQATATSGVKRVFADAIGEAGMDRRSILSKLGGNGLSDGELRAFSQLSKHPLLPPLYPWKTAKQPSLGFASPGAGKAEDKDEAKSSAADDTSSTRAPVIGWPPVQSFRKNSLAAPQSKKQCEPKGSPAVACQTPTLVKVYMDGVSIGRKVDIKSHDSYEKLSVTLEEMFHHQFDGPCPGQSERPDKKLNFLSGSDYVLTYEDKDGDLMLVGDVPWNMFTGTVKRLRIMKGSDAIGLAPRVSA